MENKKHFYSIVTPTRTWNGDATKAKIEEVFKNISENALEAKCYIDGKLEIETYLGEVK